MNAFPSTVADLDVLLSILSTPQKWIKEEFAKTSSGENLNWGSSPNAVCWCLLGATEKLCIRPHAHFQQTAAEKERRERSNKLLAKTIRKLFPARVKHISEIKVISFFNDHEETTYEDILLVIRTAKENANNPPKTP